jgi:hypothetical protein
MQQPNSLVFFQQISEVWVALDGQKAILEWFRNSSITI